MNQSIKQSVNQFITNYKHSCTTLASEKYNPIATYMENVNNKAEKGLKSLMKY